MQRGSIGKQQPTIFSQIFVDDIDPNFDDKNPFSDDFRKKRLNSKSKFFAKAKGCDSNFWTIVCKIRSFITAIFVYLSPASMIFQKTTTWSIKAYRTNLTFSKIF